MSDELSAFYRRMDFEILDMMVADPDELAGILTASEIHEMRDYLEKGKSASNGKEALSR